MRTIFDVPSRKAMIETYMENLVVHIIFYK